MAITLERALRNAVETERGAERFYRELAGRTGDREAVTLLRVLAVQESAHATAIEALAGRLDADVLAMTPDMESGEVESSPLWRGVAGLSLDQALDAALEAEIHAAAFYREAGAAVPAGDVRRFFNDMEASEDEHARAVEGLIRKRRTR